MVVYVNPRQIDPDYPRLPLPLLRRFKCYVGLKSTLPKLEWLCRNYSFCTMREMAEKYVKSFYYEKRPIPVMSMKGAHATDKQLPISEGRTGFTSRQTLQNSFLQVKEAMAEFMSHDNTWSRRTRQDT